MRSPFVGRGASLGERPWGKNPGIMRGAIFSEGRGLRARVARPEASRGIPFPPHALRMSQWPRGGNVGVGVMPSLRACGTRPSAGLVIRARMASRGKAGNNVEGGFLGGTRSARPQMRAGRKPRENIFMGGKRWPGGLMGPSLGESEVSLTGVRNPPLRGGQPRTRGLAGKGPGITLGGGFSEGRGLRACRYMRSRMRSRTPSPLPRQLGPYFFSTRRAALRYI